VSRRDLKALLFVPHPLSRIASQLLFWELDLHFTASSDAESDHHPEPYPSAYQTAPPQCDGDARHAQRSADILTRIIVDNSFANAVRTLKIFAWTRDKDGSMAFQIGVQLREFHAEQTPDPRPLFLGMLANALPKLINLRNVHISAMSEGIIPVLRTLQTTSPRLRGLSLKLVVLTSVFSYLEVDTLFSLPRSPDCPGDLSFLDFRHLSHLAYTINALSGTPTIHSLINQNRATLHSIALTNPYSSPQWIFPTNALSIRNLTNIFFTGHFPPTSHAFEDILSHGRQLETFDVSCCALECSNASMQFRSVRGANSLPFLRHFAFSVQSIGTRTVDRDLFPAIAEFLRGRRQLKSLQLIVSEQPVQHAVGFDAAIWGVLPSLEGLKGLKISYPSDLSPGLASWLIPRTVLALSLSIDYNTPTAGDPIPFLKVCIYFTTAFCLEFLLITFDLPAIPPGHTPFPSIHRSL